MLVLAAILHIFSFVLFFLAIWPNIPTRYNLIAGGLACWIFADHILALFHQ